MSFSLLGPGRWRSNPEPGLSLPSGSEGRIQQRQGLHEEGGLQWRYQPPLDLLVLMCKCDPLVLVPGTATSL